MFNPDAMSVDPATKPIVRVNISMRKDLIAIGQGIAARQHFSSFSEYIAHLIRQDWDRNQPQQLPYPTTEQQQAHPRLNESTPPPFGKRPGKSA